MSSHHIVREKQEPALLILSLDNFSREYLGQLLEWSPTVIATDDTIDELLSEEIKVDWLISDKTLDGSQNDIKLVTDHDRDHLKTALNELVDKGYGAVNIIAADADTKLLASFIKKINVVVLSPKEKIYAVRSGYQKWLPADEIISIKSDAANLVTSGLIYVTGGTYRTTADGMITLTFDNNYIFISEVI